MAINTYATLQTSIATWLERADLGAIIPDFITLAEAYFNRTLRTRQQEYSDTLTTVNGVTTLPADFLQWRSLTWNSDPTLELEAVGPQLLRTFYGSADSGVPRYFVIEGESITIRPTDDTDDYTLRYFKKVPALSNSNTTNWLLLAHPDAYLFGALSEAHGYIPEPEKMAVWKMRRDAICQEIQMLSNSMRTGRIIPRGSNP